MLPDSSEIKSLNKIDATFISTMASYVRGTLAWCQAMAAERVSHHMASLYTSNDRKRQTRFRFNEGQRVSHNGDTVVIVELVYDQ